VWQSRAHRFATEPCQAEQVDNRADQAFGLAIGKAKYCAQGQCSEARKRRGEYQGWPPRVVRGSASHAASASSVNHTVKLPRWRKLAS
jgi:hypothetical protein